jgi:uncharacterized membrane protein YhaH (DUF805 family)
MLRTIVIAFLLCVMTAFVSLNGNAEQENFNRGAIWLIGTMLLLYLAAGLLLVSFTGLPHPAMLFIRFGGSLFLVALLAYAAVRSAMLHRVM